jgi:hypothetical protein
MPSKRMKGSGTSPLIGPKPPSDRPILLFGLDPSLPGLWREAKALRLRAIVVRMCSARIHEWAGRAGPISAGDLAKTGSVALYMTEEESSKRSLTLDSSPFTWSSQ